MSIWDVFKYNVSWHVLATWTCMILLLNCHCGLLVRISAILDVHLPQGVLNGSNHESVQISATMFFLSICPNWTLDSYLYLHLDARYDMKLLLFWGTLIHNVPSENGGKGISISIIVFNN